MSAQYDINMVRGDTLEFDMTIEGDVGTVTAVAMSAAKLGAADGDTLFELSLGNGVTAIEGGYRFRVPPAATKDAKAERYRYDVQVTIGADVYTPLFGSLTLIRDVTV